MKCFQTKKHGSRFEREKRKKEGGKEKEKENHNQSRRKESRMLFLKICEYDGRNKNVMESRTFLETTFL